MEGYRVVFSTLRNRKHKDRYIHEWLIECAKELKIEGVTVINAAEGYGRDKTIHSANFFELAEQPIEVVMLVDEERCNALFAKLKEENLSIFYAKSKAEFGFTF